MKILQGLVQGTDDWLIARYSYDTASEASSMMGCHKSVSRDELIEMRATGSEKEYSGWVMNVLFKRGHEVEEKARPIAEEIVGEDIFPVTAIDDDETMLASFDGITMLEDIAWECKQWNQSKAERVESNILPEEDKWQVIQQLVISRAEKLLYMVTDGTKENTVTMWVTLGEDDEKLLKIGWEQFERDVSAYQPKEQAINHEGVTPESLPELRIKVQGMVDQSNLDAFKSHAMQAIEDINTDLQTDSDFATAEKTVKWFKSIETKLESAKKSALEQTASIDDLFKSIDEIRETARQKRLSLEKLVSHKKISIRHEIKASADEKLRAHIDAVNAEIRPYTLPSMQVDFATAMKGKKTIDSLNSAVNDLLAKTIVDINLGKDKIKAKAAFLNDYIDDYSFLFTDKNSLIHMDYEPFCATVKARVLEYKEEERQRKAREEAQKAKDEERQKALEEAAERQRIANEERRQKQAEIDRAASEQLARQQEQIRINQEQERLRLDNERKELDEQRKSKEAAQEFHTPSEDINKASIKKEIKQYLSDNSIGKTTAERVATLIVSGHFPRITLK